MAKTSLWICLIMVLYTTAACAQPANDFSVEIDHRYKIQKTSRLNTSVVRDGIEIIFSSGDYDGIGPIIEYAVTETYILTKHENSFDNTLTFFAVSKIGYSVSEPLSKLQMEEMLKVNRMNPSWKYVRHPLETFVYWLSFYFLVCLAIAISLVFWVKKIIRKKQMERSSLMQSTA